MVPSPTRFPEEPEFQTPFSQPAQDVPAVLLAVVLLTTVARGVAPGEGKTSLMRARRRFLPRQGRRPLRERTSGVALPGDEIYY
jgi:hypothetical protein